ncbi:MAG TPA: hypothetical protein VF785_03480 [Gemmatimonadaceae bacterium]
MSDLRRMARPALVLVALAAACTPLHIGPSLARPPALVGEWIDLSHTTPGDTALWVLRADGYDGSAHIVRLRDSAGVATFARSQKRYASWYLAGAITDSSKRAICFARRLGRDGATCLSFSLDTLTAAEGVRRLTIHGYRGQHRTADRELIERRVSSGQRSTDP